MSQRILYHRSAVISYGLIIGLASIGTAAAKDTSPTNRSSDKIGIQVGASVIAGNNAYATDETEVRVLPSIFYDNGRVFAKGSQIGGYLTQDDRQEIAVFLQPGGFEFDPEDAQDELKQLNEREISGLAGVSYVRKTSIGGIRGQLATDILDNSGGTVARLAYLTRLPVGGAVVYPSAGIEWVNDTYNDYYFGVSQTEAERSGVDAYAAKSSFQPYLSVNASFDVTDDWSVTVGQNVMYLSDEQYDSPMVDDRVAYRTILGASYRF